MKKTLLLLLAISFCLSCENKQKNNYSSEETIPNLVNYVNPLMGTDSSYNLSNGNTYPAIATPWGMNFWTPMTSKMGDGWTYKYDENKITRVPKGVFDSIGEIYPGMQVQEDTAEGPLLVTIKEITNDDVLIDANHPLAGQSLNFELMVKDVREATKEELDHGHVHTGQCH